MAERHPGQPRALQNLMELIRPELISPEALRQMIGAIAQKDKEAGAQAMGDMVESMLPVITSELTDVLGEPPEPITPEAMGLIREIVMLLGSDFLEIVIGSLGTLPQEPGLLEAKEPTDGQ